MNALPDLNYAERKFLIVRYKRETIFHIFTLILSLMVSLISFELQVTALLPAQPRGTRATDVGVNIILCKTNTPRQNPLNFYLPRYRSVYMGSSLLPRLSRNPGKAESCLKRSFLLSAWVSNRCNSYFINKDKTRYIPLCSSRAVGSY